MFRQQDERSGCSSAEPYPLACRYGLSERDRSRQAGSFCSRSSTARYCLTRGRPHPRGQILPGPGRPRDCSLGLPQIRICASRRIRFVTSCAVPHTARWFRGDTWSRLDVLGVHPTPCPRRGAPFAPRGPGGPVPPLLYYYGAPRLLAVHLAALRFLRWAMPSVCPLFVPTSSGQESCGSTWSW